MHLKSLTLRGFKSFASATTLRFEPGITCVVGPNGSGKSNVVDALSWVMGEQGAKSLRGGKMEDVIFAGTTGRPPLGRAEVSLTIDNSDGALPIEYAEVTITRTMFRNGGSEYQINGDTCRLLDIQELLSDSGIGREMHVIVGQGQLDSVLHADPAGRRAFIEEAAGVLKHRKRKEKALRKLDAMRANLARVQDLGDELRRQLKPLGRQAAVARRAAVIQADLRDARLRLLADDLVTLREALRAEIADEAALKSRRDAAEAGLRAAAQREAALEQQVEELTPRLAAARQTWHELSRLTERVRGTIGLADARVTSATTAPDEERRGRDPEDLEREARRVREQEAELEAALEAADRALEDTSAHRAELERRLAEEERRLRDAARALADRREELARLHGRVTAARGRVASAEAETGRLAVARDEARERAAAAQAAYELQRAETDGAEEGDAELAGRLERAKAGLTAADAALTAAREAATAADRQRAAVTARHDALALGLRRKDGTGALLSAKERLAGLLGPAAELLTVAPGHELPVAAALGAAADGVAVTGLAPAAEALRLLKKEDAGRAVLLLGGAPEPAAADRPGGLRYADGLVSGPADLLPAVRRLLRDVVVVDTLEEAEETVAAHPGLTVVTAEGDLLAAHLAQGGSGGAPSLLEVQAAVDEAAAELAELEGRCDELTEGQRNAAEERARCAALVEELSALRSTADREKSRLAQDLGRLAGQARAAAGEAERAAAAAARAEDDLLRAGEEAEELAARLAAAEELGDEEAPAEPDTSVRDRLAADGANARQTEMEARLTLRTHEERVKALAGRADSLDRAARAEREARERAERRRARLRHEARVARAVAAGARQLLAHVEVSLVRADEERQAVEAARAGREAELAGGRNRARELKAELDKLTDSVHRGEVLGAEKRLRIEQLEARALEEFGMEPGALAAEYGPGQPVPPVPPAEGEEPREPAPVPYVRAEQEKRLRAAERAYQQLGKVNPLALEEFAALEERHKFLSEQLEDLKKTRADLLQVVKDVDRRVEEVFTAAYRDTAREFEGVFSRLFPGGEGRLVLTDPDDMLATGVDVEARPPGKKVKRLSLLSGGERSLTAVALLVAIFKARPSPFYVMDEVEAALDDTNLQRLIRIMRELQESSQLIVITHQKRTMEVADALYGVSMQGDGVSKVISQRLR
ncbi:chromosome segregation protein SMC [Streptomyces sp. AV19]|uniref:chromosome segregation protein SMC n=1 Tax=Streptomyces sp. AV19 TaxID=2793068 RepID=UPI0018FED1F9|nr:chromosome segregation protein SMC [Streptomyces sp. AV19]MBH1933978.1 chromosome segregation protein SMC [Streptomyces sp. AV19]MDG4535538.1 chromosome segregation protein SMC [Streptomyces sp. AV19]